MNLDKLAELADDREDDIPDDLPDRPLRRRKTEMLGTEESKNIKNRRRRSSLDRRGSVSNVEELKKWGSVAHQFEQLQASNSVRRSSLADIMKTAESALKSMDRVLVEQDLPTSKQFFEGDVEQGTFVSKPKAEDVYKTERRRSTVKLDSIQCAKLAARLSDDGRSSNSRRSSKTSQDSSRRSSKTNQSDGQPSEQGSKTSQGSSKVSSTASRIVGMDDSFQKTRRRNSSIRRQSEVSIEIQKFQIFEDFGFSKNKKSAFQSRSFRC